MKCAWCKKKWVYLNLFLPNELSLIDVFVEGVLEMPDVRCRKCHGKMWAADVNNDICINCKNK